MDIQHVTGKANLVTDCLSRAILGAIHLLLNPDVQVPRSAV